MLSAAMLAGGCGSSARRISHTTSSGLGSEPPQSQPAPHDPSIDGQVLAKVGRYSFTRGYVERWAALQVVLSSPYKHTSHVPTGYVPDPPSYRYCVAYLQAKRGEAQSAAGTAQSSTPPSSAGLKRQCEASHQLQSENALGHLLRYAWIHLEAAKRGISVSSVEIRTEVAKRGIKLSILRALGVRPSDQEFIVGAEMLTRKLFDTLPAYRKLRRTHDESMRAGEEVDNENTRFYSTMEKRWTARTHCPPGFLVPGCSEYVAQSGGPSGQNGVVP